VKFRWPTQKLPRPLNFPSFSCGPLETCGPLGAIWPTLRTTGLHHTISLAVSAAVHKWLMQTVMVLLQAEIFRFLFTCTFPKLKKSTVTAFLVNVHHRGTEISFKLPYDNINKDMRKLSALLTLNTFLALCFYVKQLSNDMWRGKPVVPDISVVSHPSVLMFTCVDLNA
jgi:hypothetical protein